MGRRMRMPTSEPSRLLNYILLICHSIVMISLFSTEPTQGHHRSHMKHPSIQNFIRASSCISPAKKTHHVSSTLDRGVLNDYGGRMSNLKVRGGDGVGSVPENHCQPTDLLSLATTRLESIRMLDPVFPMKRCRGMTQRLD